LNWNGAESLKMSGHVTEMTTDPIGGASEGGETKTCGPPSIDWIGDIPAHWKVTRLKFIISEPLRYGANAVAEFDKREWPRFVRITDINELGGLRDETFRSLPPEVAQGFLLQPNDILLARSGTVGKSFIYSASWGVACYASYLIRARIAKQHDARYFYWFLNSALYWDWIRSASIQSTIENVNAKKYSNLQIPHPSSKNEQKTIADFLDHETARIDQLVEKKKRLVELLEEKRSSLITAAVTGTTAEGGGGATFPEVPIGAAFDIFSGATPASGQPAYWGGDIPWVGPADLGKLDSRFIELGERSITAEGYASCGTQMVPKGTIILSIRAPIGHMAITSQPMCFNQGCRGLVPRPKWVHTDFAYWSLIARKPQLEAAGQGTTFVELGRDKLRAERIPLPDLDTQKTIADFLDRETTRIDKITEKTQRSIDLLKEFRAALITAAVTGQIDMASWTSDFCLERREEATRT